MASQTASEGRGRGFGFPGPDQLLSSVELLSGFLSGFVVYQTGGMGFPDCGGGGVDLRIGSGGGDGGGDLDGEHVDLRRQAGARIADKTHVDR